MSSSLMLSPTWGLMLDVNGNIAVVGEPYSLAQDAASAIQTYLGEVYWDSTLGVPWLTQVFGQNPPVALLKQLLVNAAISANSDIASAQVFLSSFNNRQVAGQVLITSKTSGQIASASFTVGSVTGGTG